MILVSMSPKQDTPISWARPSKYFRGFLSLGIWLPLATVSYSVYLWHHIPMAIISVIKYGDQRKAIAKLTLKNDCEEIVKIGVGPAITLFFGTLLSATLIASLSYVFVEKPAIEARRVFKTKW